MSTLRDRYRQVAEFVNWYSRDYGYTPSGDEIAEELQITRSYAYELLDRMEAQGLITRPRPHGKALGRNIRLSRGAMKALEETL